MGSLEQVVQKSNICLCYDSAVTYFFLFIKKGGRIFFFFPILFVCSTSLAQDYAGAAVGTAVAKLIIFFIYVILIVLGLCFLFFARSKRRFGFYSALCFLIVFSLEYRFVFALSFFKKYLPLIEHQVLNVDSSKYFILRNSNKSDCRSGELVFINQKTGQKVPVADHVSYSSMDTPNQVYHFDDSIVVAPDAEFNSYFWSKDSLHFSKSHFIQTASSLLVEKIQFALVQDGKIFVITNDSTNTYRYYLSDDQLNLRPTTKNASETWLNLPIPEKENICGRIINFSWIHRLVEIASFRF